MFKYGLCLKPDCLYDYQALVAGVLAIIAAFITAVSLWMISHKEILVQQKLEKELRNRKLMYIKTYLLIAFQAIAIRASLEKDKLSNNREVTKLRRLGFVIIDNEWDFMSLLPANDFFEIMVLKHLVSEYNTQIDELNIINNSNEAWNLPIDYIIDCLNRVERRAKELENKMKNLLNISSD